MATELLAEMGSGGRTKWNRTRLGLPKTHSLDVLCAGRVSAVHGAGRSVWTITATGRGSYQRTRLTRDGFPRGYLTRTKRHVGFQTADLVRATTPRARSSRVA